MKYTKKKELFKKQKEISDLWDKFKQPSKHVVGVPKEKEIGEGREKICKEIMAENFSNFSKKRKHYKPTDPRMSKSPNHKKHEGNYIIKLFKISNKEKNLKSIQRKKIHHGQRNKKKNDSRFLTGNNTSRS